MPFNTTYWMRSSADGRYLGNGLGKHDGTFFEDGASGYIVDLAIKNPASGHRIISVDGPYDPGFFADNSAFTWHLDDGAAFCQQSALAPGYLTGEFYSHLSMLDDNKCSVDPDMGTYQHPGASLSNNLAKSEYWVVLGEYGGDDTGSTINPDSASGTGETDPNPLEFSNLRSKLEVTNIFSNRESSAAFNFKERAYISTPFEGDFGIAPSGSIVTS